MGRLHELARLGQSVWLDNLTRDMIRDGTLRGRIRDEGLRGVTSNPAIFNKAMGSGTAYDAQLRQLRAGTADPEALYEALAVTDVREACDLFQPLYEETGGRDGFVSLEVSPHVAHDATATMEAARHLFGAVDRPNCLIKIPGTVAGLEAIEEMLFEGIPVNITLLFSGERYEKVAQCYIRAFERRLRGGRSMTYPPSVASFFLSRIDVLTDRLLRHRIHANSTAGSLPERLLGSLAVANAKLAYRRFRRVFSADRWRALEAAGARVQRPLWASTGNKNPDYRDVRYVEPLVGRDTVSTMPEKTMAAVADHADVVADSIEQGLDAAREAFLDLEAAGIDFDCVTQQLEDEGIQKFIDPYDELIAKIRAHG